MSTGKDWGRTVVRFFWLGAACSFVGMAMFGSFGWDAREYLSASQHYQAYIHGQEHYSLAYSPLFMIPMLGVVKVLPLWLTFILFGIAYFSGLFSQLWVEIQIATSEERRILRFLAPALVFFPGLLISDSDVIASGNVAYMLYGAMLASAAWGWKSGRWNWFYVAVLASGCVKAQLLTMLAIPLLCGSHQWRRASLVGAAGIGLYAAQIRIWPQAFHTYMSTVGALSQSRRDFGCGPTGNLARLLQHNGVAYYKPCILFYVLYAAIFFAILLSLSRLYRENMVSFSTWAPVMLLGVALLNPRILPYDVAAVTLPMALILCRSANLLGEAVSRPKRIAAVVLGFAGINVVVETVDGMGLVPDAAKYAEMFLMFGIFASGAWGLIREAACEQIPSPTLLMRASKTESIS